MFLLDYLILEEEIERLSNITEIEEFEQDLNTVLGQIQIVFNNEKEGFVDKDIPLGNEFLITWFKRFDDVLIQLRSNEIVALNMPHRDSVWLEFQMKNKFIEVSKVKAAKQNNVYNFIETKPVNRAEILWKQAIKKEPFFKEILNKTENLLKDILLINPILAESVEIKALLARCEQIKS